MMSKEKEPDGYSEGFAKLSTVLRNGFSYLLTCRSGRLVLPATSVQQKHFSRFLVIDRMSQSSDVDSETSSQASDISEDKIFLDLSCIDVECGEERDVIYIYWDTIRSCFFVHVQCPLCGKCGLINLTLPIL
jgi:hypothetical protein